MNWIGLYGHLLLLLLLLLLNNGESKAIIKTLPGYSGTLPFKLETGYIGVGEDDQEQLFYYFIESENDPATDPLLLWMAGGPGCSGLFSLVFDIGPFTVDIENYDGGLPSILINQYSWTKAASIIFIDAPVGTGFSYANSSKGCPSSDTKNAKDIHTFLRKWLLDHPMFIKNRLYVAGESYGGKLVPMVGVEILRGNKARLQPQLSFQGYIIGNGITNEKIDYNARISYAHRMALISDEYYELAKTSCDGKYFNRDPNNQLCANALQPIKECLHRINQVHVYEQKCTSDGPTSNGPDDFGWGQKFVVPRARKIERGDNSVDHLVLPTAEHDCQDILLVSDRWANDQTVQEALSIRKGTITTWRTCYFEIPFEKNIEGVLEFHKVLMKEGLDVFLFHGDLDLGVPYIAPLTWIRAVNLTIDKSWRAWFVNNQVAGYMEKYKKNDFHLTFATIRGAGHIASWYQREESLAMISRWLSRSSL